MQIKVTDIPSDTQNGLKKMSLSVRLLPITFIQSRMPSP